LLGTDRLGRDVLSRLLAGARISLIAGLLATALAVLLAGVLGALAGLAGGWLDHLLMRLAELFLALPWLYLLLALRAFLPLDLSPSLSGILVVVLLGGLGWAAPARQVRGLVLGLRQREFLLAARGLGVSRWRILRRHLLPQILPLLSTQGSQLIPRMITAEVSLSFLGLGVAEPLPSLGSLLAELLHLHVLVSAWWMFSPAALLIGIILSYHLCARALQQRFLSSAS
jgi:peptide/nickel transport system permease protein